MHRVWVGLACVVWLVTISASGAMNALAGYRFGQSHWDGLALAGLGIAADLWKAIGPIFIAALFAAKRKTATALATMTWLACFLFAVSAAIGFAGSNRAGVAGDHERVSLTLADRVRELEQLQKTIDDLSDRRSSREIEAAIEAILARAVPNRGTVGKISNGCRRDDAATRAACEEVAQERRALARLHHIQNSIARSKALRDDIENLRERGGHIESDPQSALIARLLGSRVARQDVSIGLVLLLVIMVELISAFAPVVVRSYLATLPMRQASKTAVDVSRIDAGGRAAPESSATTSDIVEFLTASIAPSPHGRVELAVLYTRYLAWCKAVNTEVVEVAVFDRIMEKIGSELLSGAIRREGEWLRGLDFKAK